MTTTSLARQQQKEATARLYSLLCDGLSEREVQEEMGLTAAEFDQLRAAMMEQKSDEYRGRPVEHIFVQYMIDQNRNVRELSDMIPLFKAARQYNTMVGAVRARAEILDKMIERGQEFGLIEKRPDEKVVHAGLVVSNLSHAQLREAISGIIEEVNALSSGITGDHFIDVDPESALPTPPPRQEIAAPDAVDAKRYRANGNRVRAGRKVIKEKLDLSVPEGE